MSLEAAIVPSIRQSMRPVREASKESPARIGQAATDFEAILLGQMLKSARESEEGDDEVLQNHCKSGRGKAEDCGHLAGRSKNDKQD